MKIMLMAASLAALSFASADLALAQGNGKGNGGDKDKGGQAEQGGGPGKDKSERVKGNDVAKAERRADVQLDRRDLRSDRNVAGDDRRDDDDRIRFRVADRGLIAGCPPGLAKKNNGCLPPGQAKKLDAARTRYDDVWNRRNDDNSYRYEDGYLYRSNAQGGLLGYQPVLGGALGLGKLWPAQYGFDPVPDYYSRYFGLQDQYQYRYADGALYGLDPKTQAISKVAALLTGQDWNVGQPMPAGYDVYNVPTDYRARYPDSAQSQYRYSDGHVYQVDPKTRLVQAVIQLLT